MAIKLKIKKGDQVIVRAGKDKGKRGEVIKVFPKESRVLVSGVNIVKRHLASKQGMPSEIRQKESPLHISNVGLVDPKTGLPTRVGFRYLEDGSKVRVAKRSGETFSNG